jgi:anti-sigma regulatory factor (Ser/Thr protein kinase)
MQTAVNGSRLRGPTLLRLVAEPAALAAGRDAVRERLSDAGWGQEGVALAVLAVGEALANAIEHGSLPGAPVGSRPRSPPEATRRRSS